MEFLLPCIFNFAELHLVTLCHKSKLIDIAGSKGEGTREEAGGPRDG